MKSNFKSFILMSLVFTVVYISILFIFMSLGLSLYRLGLLSAIVAIIGSFILSLFVSITFVVLLIINKRWKKIKFIEFFIDNVESNIAFLIIVIIFLWSINDEVFMTTTLSYNILNISWTIFGISIGAFVFWYTINENKFNNLILKSDSVSDYERLSLTAMKNEKVKQSFICVVYIFINLLALCVVSGCYFIVSPQFNGIDIYIQTLLIFAMYMSTNTLAQLIIHALILPIIEMRNENKKMALDIENISKKEFEMSVVKLEKQFKN